MEGLTRLVREALADRYTVERELGTGAMATVYLARENDLDRHVAIKVLHPSYSSAVPRDRFRREISLVSKLSHPHIVPIFADGEAEGLLYYVMPYVGGETLRDRMRRSGALPITDALRIATEVAHALSYAHDAGVVHRDIKPENILLAQGHAVVADFGIARALDRAGGDSLTQAGAVLGTPAYMSPEQGRGADSVDGRSDIYSLGAVLHELVHGTPFVPGARGPAGDATSAVPGFVQDLVSQATRAKPAERFQSAAEFAGALRHAESLITARQPAPRKGMNRSALGSAVLLTVLAAGFFLWWNSGARASDDDGPRTIAVLPFENIGTENDDFFAAGVTDEIASTLARIPGLQIISRTSVMEVDRTSESLLEIGSRLGATYALEGSVRTDRSTGREGRVRVSPQLLRISDGARIGRWSAFDADLEPGDLFRVQTDIAEQVAHVLNVTLLGDPADPTGPAGPPTTNQSAYEHYLRGVSLWNRGVLGSDEQDRLLAIQQYERAVELDPEFALAHAKLAGAHSWVFSTFLDRSASRIERARGAAQRAIDLEPTLPEAHVALGWYHFTADLDYSRARLEFEEALQIDPNDTEALFALGFVNQQLGDLNRALSAFERRLDLDPLSARAIISVANIRAAMGDADVAERLYQRAISLAPDLYVPYVRLALLQLHTTGDTAVARQTIRDGAQQVGTAEFVVRLAQDRAAVVRTLGAPFFDTMDGLPAAVFGADSARYYLNRAMIANARGDRALALYRSARRILEQEQRAGALTPAGYAELAIALANLGETNPALLAAERSVTLAAETPDVVELHRRRQEHAEVLVVLRRYDQAVAVLREALDASIGFEDPLLSVDPVWTPLRGRAGYDALLTREE